MLINSLIASALLTIALSAPPSCPNGWKLYQPRNVCFFEYTTLKSWQQAREKCQESGADLLQIEDEAMNDWVKVNRRQKDFAHWIGVGDQDVDGKFEYIDGHDLVTASSNLGFRNITGWPNKGDCVLQRKDDNGWGAGNCSVNLRYLCERPHGLNDLTNPCSGGWFLYQAEMKCIGSPRSLKSWAEARKHCQESGGDLLVVGDKNKEEFVKDRLVNRISSAIWIGVKYSQENGDYELVNGQKLYPESKGLGKWGKFRNYNSRKDNFCVYQQYYNEGWGNSKCSAELKFFCGKSLYPKELPQTTAAPTKHRCRDSAWAFYQPRNMCITETPTKHSWEVARHACKNLGADLLQIEDEDMNKWVKDEIRNSDHWIAVIDRNLDGKFDYLDGRRLEVHGLDLEFRNVTGKPFRGDCVYQEREEMGWSTSNCEDELMSICEIPSEPGRKSKYGSCKPDSYLYEPEGVCIKSVDELMSWSDASNYCKDLGGDLVVIEDKPKDEFVKEKRRGGYPQWIGLKFDLSYGFYLWEKNGKELYPYGLGLGKWGLLTPYNKEKTNNCVYQQSNSSDWGNADCNLPKHALCGQTIDPNANHESDADVDEEEQVPAGNGTDSNVVPEDNGTVEGESAIYFYKNTTKEQVPEATGTDSNVLPEDNGTVEGESGIKDDEEEQLPEGYGTDSNVLPEDNGTVDDESGIKDDESETLSKEYVEEQDNDEEENEEEEEEEAEEEEEYDNDEERSRMNRSKNPFDDVKMCKNSSKRGRKNRG